MLKYHMNRKEKEITDPVVLNEIMKRGKYVTIAMCRENEPYIVALNYGYDENKNSLYFHCSLKGLKLDFIKHNPAVCATVIEDRGYKIGDCSQAYRSVVFWGKMYLIEDSDEKKHGINILLNHLEDNPGEIKEKSLKSDDVYKEVGILRLDITEISGKQGS